MKYEDSKHNALFDIVTIGETMLRMTPANGLRWEQAEQWEMHVGGSESNTAAGLARLGMRVAWLSRLTNNPLGHKISRCLASHGVDIDQIIWTDQDRIGTYFYEPAAPPRDAAVLYDRVGSSFSRFSADMLPLDLFAPGKSRLLHYTGISLALGTTTQNMIQRAVELAKQAGWLISLDINHRAKLMGAVEAKPIYEKFASQADIVFVPVNDARLLWNCSVNDQELAEHPEQAAMACLKQLASSTKANTLVLTLGRHGAAAVSEGKFHYAATIVVPAVGRLGTGDAFSAGFLSAWFRSHDISVALQYGNAAACLKYSMPGDMPYFTRLEVETLVRHKASADAPFR